jgi:hypothetical protein
MMGEDNDAGAFDAGREIAVKQAGQQVKTSSKTTSRLASGEFQCQRLVALPFCATDPVWQDKIAPSVSNPGDRWFISC